jgi:hypothetical protein
MHDRIDLLVKLNQICISKQREKQIINSYLVLNHYELQTEESQIKQQIEISYSKIHLD